MHCCRRAFRSKRGTCLTGFDVCRVQIYNCKEQIVGGEEDEVCVIGNDFDIEPYVANERDYK